MKKTKRMVLLSLLTSIALVIYVIEAQIPVILPGIKLGLANAISLLALIIMGPKEALIIMFLRTLLGTFLGGNMSSFLYSISGGILSNVIMIILYTKFKESFSLWSISIVGAIFHNIGQLFVASLVVQDFKVYFYLPILMISAIAAGYFIGLVTNFLSKHLEKIPFLKEIS
ncbi:Gx transporter family protein [Clostridium peptidivorans]|uniref:Gx transporter family protein n=1 Tax=Clostridium peptidivorans TaxID=100174 RepID=UPI000BE24184|nr:Gx transporter family protein [Clostridium peptidivorans]